LIQGLIQDDGRFDDTSYTILPSNLHYIVNSAVLLSKVHSAKEQNYVCIIILITYFIIIFLY